MYAKGREWGIRVAGISVPQVIGLEPESGLVPIRVHSRAFAAELLTDYNQVMADLGKFLLVMAGIIAALGVLLLFAGKLNLPLGRLPGDITCRGKNTVVYFPLATSLIISVVLSLLLWLINRGRN